MAQGPLAGDPCATWKGLGHQREDMGWGACSRGLGFRRAGSGAGLEAALVHRVVTRSHWQRWG